MLEIHYGEGWDGDRRAVAGPLSREQAQARDAAGEQYAVVALMPQARLPLAVLHVAWAEHYLGVWLYDAAGRRSGELDLRRIEEKRLFLRYLSMWDYRSVRTAEFAEEAPRLWMDLEPTGEGWQSELPQGERGPLRRSAARLPEQRRWVAMPEFGDWAGLLAAVTDGTVSGLEWSEPKAPGEGVAAGPEPLWLPPRPAWPRQVDALFRPGALFEAGYGTYTVHEPVEAGRLRLPSGRLVACDPGAPAGGPFTAEVSPGEYAMQLAYASYPMANEDAPELDHRHEELVAARLLISEQPVVWWEPAQRPGEDLRLLGEGQFYGFGVDTGTACFADAEALEAGDPEAAGALIAYATGGDGAYPVWIGRDAAGEVACFVADMMVLYAAELRA